MGMHLRQVALVAGQLDEAVESLTSSLGIEVSFRDPGVATFGLVNAVMPVGKTFLEVVSPVKEDASAGRYLARRGGDGGYMVIIEVDDLVPNRQRVQALGMRIVLDTSTKGWSGIHLHPADTGGPLMSFDQVDPPGSWSPAGADWPAHVRTDVVSGISAAEIQSDDPDKLAARWSEILGRPVTDDDRTIALDSGTLRFVTATDGRPEGLGGIDLTASDRSRAGETLNEVGMRLRFV